MLMKNIQKYPPVSGFGFDKTPEDLAKEVNLLTDSHVDSFWVYYPLANCEILRKFPANSLPFPVGCDKTLDLSPNDRPTCWKIQRYRSHSSHVPGNKKINRAFSQMLVWLKMVDVKKLLEI